MPATLTARSFTVEGTGGGCTASVRYLPDGRVLVMTDGNLSHVSEDDGSDAYNGAVFATVEDWNDGSDPVRTVDGTLSHVLSTLSALQS